MKVISLSLFAIILICVGRAEVCGQSSVVSPLPVGPETVAEIESSHEILSDRDTGLPLEHPSDDPTVEEPVVVTGTVPGVHVALSQSEVDRRTAAVRAVFGESQKWIFPVDHSSAPSASAPLSGSSFRLDIAAHLQPIRFIDDPPAAFTDDPPKPDTIEVRSGFQWRQAINQSLILIGIQHGYALAAQEKTRRALKGPFFRDYWRSVKGLKGWDDGNRFFTNYIAHPMQGGLTGFIYVQNSPRAIQQKFGESKQYWKDRFNAFLWSTAWSTQWELGPISQSAIGNVGMYGGMGYVDLVITPTVGTGWLIAEEAIDRYVIRKLETSGDTVRKLSRMLLNPMRSVANLLRFKHPWYRDRPVGY